MGTKDFQEALDNLKQTKPAPAGKVRTNNTLEEDEQDYHLLQLPTSLPHTTITYNHTITQHREGQAMDTKQFVVGVGEGTQAKHEEQEQDLSDGEDSYGYTNNNNINHLLQLPTSLPHTTITYRHTITQHREGQAMDTEQFVVGVGEGTQGK